MMFGMVKKFKEVVTSFALANGYDLKYVISNSNRKRCNLSVREHVNLGCMPYGIIGE